MKTKILAPLFIWILILLSNDLCSQTQFECGGVSDSVDTNVSDPLLAREAAQTCTTNSSLYLNKYELQDTYIPAATDPTLTIKVTLHIFQPTVGVGVWQASDEPYLRYLMSTVIHSTSPSGGATQNTEQFSSDRWANYNIPGYTAPTNWQRDAKIRFELTNVYYYQNQANYNSSTYSANAILFWFHTNQTLTDRYNEGLPIIYVNGGGPVRCQKTVPYAPAIFTGFGLNNPDSSLTFDTNFVRTNLRHELGHALGLGHPYTDPMSGTVTLTHNQMQHGELTVSTATNAAVHYYNPCGTKNYLDDVFINFSSIPNSICNASVPCYSVTSTYSCPTCYEWYAYSNNVMHNNGNTWMSPKQMGRRLMILHLPNYREFRLRQLVKDMSSNHLTTWDINNDEVWDFDIQLYKDIVVKANKTLTIKCKVAMPIAGKITVEKGAQLIIDGGLVTTWCKSGLWAGIRVEGDVNSDQTINPTTGYATYQGVMRVINGGTISLASTGVTNFRTDNTDVPVANTTGGIIITDNAFFINNVRDAHFNSYLQHYCVSRFYNTGFLTTGAINGGQAPYAHVLLYGVQGLQFYGCRFECIATGTFSYTQRGNGILSFDAGFNVNRICAGAGCSAPIATLFKHLIHGIYCLNSNPLAGMVSAYNSSFVDNTYDGINLLNVNYAIAEFNSFHTAGVSPYTASGIYLNSCKLYAVKSNTFEQQAGTQVDQAIVAYNSQSGAHQIYRNKFKNFNIGINAPGNNSGPTNFTDGLLMNCNDFSPGGNNYNISMGGTGAPTVKWKQGVAGSGNATATRNRYSATCGNQNMWYILPYGTKQVLHYSSNDSWAIPGTQPSCSNPLLVLSNSGTALNYATSCPGPIASSGGTATTKNVKMENIISFINFLKGNGGDPFEIQASVASRIGLFLEDSLASSQDSVITILTNDDGQMEDVDIQLIFAYMTKGDFSGAADLINGLGEERADWKSLLEKLNDIYQEDEKIYSLLDTTKTYKEWMEAYAETEDDGCQIAKALLKFVFGTEYTDPKPVPDEEAERPSALSVDDLETDNSEISVYPNPAMDYITVRCNVSEDEKRQIRIDIQDLLGKVIFSNFIGNLDKGNISLSTCANGVYFISAKKNKEVIYRTKIVKQN